MDAGAVNLALKQIQEDYKLSKEQMTVLYHRFIADDREFEKVWKMYKSKKTNSGVDKFKELLTELLS